MQQDSTNLSIADEFSPFPAGRVPEDGEFNGKAFRERLLAPRLRAAIEANQKLTVQLDGLKSCGSSFLESAFGGLVRYDSFSRTEIVAHLSVVHKNPTLERYSRAIQRHIEKAKPS